MATSVRTTTAKVFIAVLLILSCFLSWRTYSWSREMDQSAVRLYNDWMQATIITHSILSRYPSEETDILHIHQHFYRSAGFGRGLALLPNLPNDTKEHYQSLVRASEHVFLYLFALQPSQEHIRFVSDQQTYILKRLPERIESRAELVALTRSFEHITETLEANMKEAPRW